jgi:hypothetical protein
MYDIHFHRRLPPLMLSQDSNRNIPITKMDILV